MISGLRFGISDVGSSISGFGFEVDKAFLDLLEQPFSFRVLDPGFRVQDFGFLP